MTAARVPDLQATRPVLEQDLTAAVCTLEAAGVGADQVRLRSAGVGVRAGSIAALRLAAGDAIGPATRVELVVGGGGLLARLPPSLRDAGTDEHGDAREVSLAQLADVLDDPFLAATVLLRRGLSLYDLRSGDPEVCRRWISLFGLDPDDWPESVWFPLAVLLPVLPDVAGSETGVRLACRLICGLPCKAIRRYPVFAELDPVQRMALGSRNGRLAFDALLGAGLPSEAGLTVVLGPVGIGEYRRWHREEARLLAAVMRLVLPFHLPYRIEWLVGDPDRAPRLGDEAQNSVLGISTHLGKG